jgi:adenylylsulfate kinase-like enzyme
MRTFENYQVIWLTGQPGAGKTTIGEKIKEEINSLTDKKAVLLDGDDIRLLFNNQDYSLDGRRKNIAFVQTMSDFLIKNDIIPIICLVSPFKDLRELTKQKYNTLEIFVHCSELRGREQFHVDYYEKPDENFINLDTTSKTIEESFETLKQH